MLGSSFLLGIGIAIAAGPVHSAEQLAVLPPSTPSTGASLTLPDVVVRPVEPALHPYTSGLGPRISSNPALRVEHYDVPADYDNNVAMHPYTSLQGPCPQGGNAGADICKRQIPPSKYRQSGEGH
jgi:hypothetical protein